MEDKLTVIFDFDGTLANTIELVGKIYNNHAHEFGAIPVDLTDLDAYRKLGYKKAIVSKNQQISQYVTKL